MLNLAYMVIVSLPNKLVPSSNQKLYPKSYMMQILFLSSFK
jgi:hypothetical protein